MEKTNDLIYITTTLPYSNGDAHVGHAIEFVQADFLTRYFRKTNDVFFNLGLDEHGQKIFNSAKDLGVDTQEYLDTHYENWLKFCDTYNIDYDNFYRTSSDEHKSKVSDVWLDLLDRGLIYKKKYSGKYCEGCESFKTDKDLSDGVCTDHPNNDIQDVTEENYFFKLSDYREQLIEWIGKNEKFLSPHNKLPELINLIKDIDDISVSRLKSSVSWGISVPNDDTQVIYVWLDALCNYIFSAGGYWNGKTIQICGPDNIKFQGVIFQGLLQSLWLKNTEHLIVHGTILDANGDKIGKSNDNVIDPLEQVEKYGIEAVRYYLLSSSTTGNIHWDEEKLVKNYNNHIVNDFGNLVTRVLHLIDQKEVNVIKATEEFSNIVEENKQLINKSISNGFNIHEYCSRLNQLTKYGNQYINDTTPWKLSDPSQELSNLHHLLSELNELYSPIIPSKHETIKQSLIEKKKQIIFNRII